MFNLKFSGKPIAFGNGVLFFIYAEPSSDDIVMQTLTAICFFFLYLSVTSDYTKGWLSWLECSLENV